MRYWIILALALPLSPAAVAQFTCPPGTYKFCNAVGDCYCKPYFQQ